MKTPQQCQAERDDAGTAYQHAAREFIDAYCELQAQSVRLTSAHVSDGGAIGVFRATRFVRRRSNINFLCLKSRAAIPPDARARRGGVNTL